MITQDNIDDLNNRIKSLEELQNEYPSSFVVLFCEIRLTKEQLSLCSKLFGIPQDEVFGYIKNKHNLMLCLKDSVYTQREENSDFQYLIDLGVKALSLGLTVD